MVGRNVVAALAKLIALALAVAGALSTVAWGIGVASSAQISIAARCCFFLAVVVAVVLIRCFQLEGEVNGIKDKMAASKRDSADLERTVLSIVERHGIGRGTSPEELAAAIRQEMDARDRQTRRAAEAQQRVVTRKAAEEADAKAAEERRRRPDSLERWLNSWIAPDGPLGPRGKRKWPFQAPPQPPQLPASVTDQLPPWPEPPRNRPTLPADLDRISDWAIHAEPVLRSYIAELRAAEEANSNK